MQIAGAFLFILVTHIPGLLKAGSRTSIVFGLIWSAGLGISLLVTQGIFLPVTYIFNYIFDIIADIARGIF